MVTAAGLYLQPVKKSTTRNVNLSHDRTDRMIFAGQGFRTGSAGAVGRVSGAANHETDPARSKVHPLPGRLRPPRLL